MAGIGTEAAIFLYAGLSGMTVFFAYRILGCIRKILPHSSAAVGAEDIIFWTGTSGYLFYCMYITTYGGIRWFFALGVVCGCIAAYFSVLLMKKLAQKFKVKSKKKLENSDEKR